MDFNNSFRSIQVIHYAIMMSTCMIFFILYFVVGPNPNLSSSPINENIFLIFAILPWIGSRFVYRNGINKALSENSITKKLEVYKSSLIIAIAIAEFISILAIISYFFIFPSTNLLFVIGIGIISIFLLSPKRKKVLSELNIKEKEIK